VARKENETILRNYRGERYAYPEPRETDCTVPYDEIFYPSQAAQRPAPKLRILP
jgi:hypothetical protein